jgi:ribonuclease D
MTKKTLPPPLWVASKTALEEMADALAREPRIAIDTESNSLHAYKEQVCLIQFSTPTQDYLLDPLALDDISILAPLFKNLDIEKIFHAAEYDLICLKRDFNFHFTNLFDTMIAARILGYKKVGLGSLLDQKFNVKVDKKFQKADWGKRPLTGDMLNYARLDTHYLIEMREMLQKELKDKDHWDLAQEDFEIATSLEGINDRKPLPIWERVGGRNRLDPRQATILNEVCLAREHLAAKLNRPPFKIIGNKSLLKLAETQPRSQRDLEIEGFSPRQIHGFSKPFLAAVKRGLSADLVTRTPSPRPSDSFMFRFDKLRIWRKEKALSIGVESDIVLPRFLMETIAKKGSSNLDDLEKVMAKSPWRFKEYGEEILKITL